MLQHVTFKYASQWESRRRFLFGTNLKPSSSTSTPCARTSSTRSRLRDELTVRRPICARGQAVTFDDLAALQGKSPPRILLMLAEMSQLACGGGLKCDGALLMGGLQMVAIIPVCYLRGTSIRTTKTDVGSKTSRLAISIVTFSGESKPIKWLGRQQFEEASGLSWTNILLPVRLCRFALDEHTPHRDLYVSPNHGLYFDGVLIPAIYLVNGTSIVQACPRALKRSITSTSSFKHTR